MNSTANRLVLETPRMILRPYQADDYELSREQMTDPDVVKYITGEVLSEDKLAERISKSLDRSICGNLGIWVLIDRETQEKLGTAVLLPLPENEIEAQWSDIDLTTISPQAKIEVGYILTKPAWGKGYATESCTRLIEFGFEETPLEVIWAVTDPENTASQHVLRKSGLQDDGQIVAYKEILPLFKVTKYNWLIAKQS